MSNYDLVRWATGIISAVDDPETGWPHQTHEWRQAARKWLDAVAADGERDWVGAATDVVRDE